LRAGSNKACVAICPPFAIIEHAIAFSAASVRSDWPACMMEWVIVSTIGSGNLEVGYGGEKGAEEARLV